jgi:hypothetical protein
MANTLTITLPRRLLKPNGQPVPVYPLYVFETALVSSQLCLLLVALRRLGVEPRSRTTAGTSPHIVLVPHTE